MTSEVRSSEPLKLLVDPPAAGAWNMGVDEMLMERAAEAGTAVLRFYEWTPATLSLGYFQNAADRSGHEASRTAPMVRRSSGGGAIVHDRELTYSISLPTSHPLAADAETLTDVYSSIDLELQRVDEPREVTALFAAGGAVLLALGACLSLAWLGRVM